MNIARMGLKGRLVVSGLVALAVASALIGWGASQQASYKRTAENQTAENARHADYDIRYRCVPLPPLAERNCSIDRRREQRDYERHEQDLYAQKTSAFWTFLIGSAAIVGMLLSAIGVFLVFFTFGETRRANILNMRENARSTRRAVASATETAMALEAANKSAQAAADQVEIAQDTAYRQLRAYLSIEDIIIRSVTADSIHGSFLIKNSGKTPAAIQIFLANCIAEHPLLTRPANAKEPVLWPSVGPFINANSAEKVDWFYAIGLHVSDEEARTEIGRLSADSVALALYLMGRIEFLDFQKHQRVLRFAYRHHGTLKIGGKGQMVAAAFGNDYEDRGKEA